MKAKDNVKYAMIEGNEVIQIFTKSDMPAWNESAIHAVEIPQNEAVEVGFFYDAVTNTFTPPSIEDLRDKKFSQLFYYFEREVQYLRGNKTIAEIESWEMQAQEAENYLQNAQANTPILDEIAQKRGIEKSQLARKVLENNRAYKASYGKLLAYQQALRKQIQNAQNAQELSAIIYESPLQNKE